MSVGRNVLAGIANSAWTALLGLAAVPLYLRFLGIESYGLIGFYATAQAMFQLLDMGLAPTMNREVARCSASGRMPEARNLLRTLSVVYWLTAGLIAVLACLAAPLVATRWLNAQSLSADTLLHAVMLIGVVIACRWPIGLYQGALMGMQRLAVVSAINVAMVTTSIVGAVAILAFASPTVEAFFIWQASVAMLHVAVIRAAAWKYVGRDGAGTFNSAALKRVWRFAAGMSGMAISSIFLTQLDKLLLSRMLSLKDFGGYVLAGVIASGLYVLLTPVFNVIYPRMTALVSTGEEDQLLEHYKVGTQLLSSILFPVAAAVAFFPADILQVWTGNAILAESAGPLVSILIIGSALNGVMHFPLALQLAAGRSDLTLAITLALTVCLVPMIILLTSRYGAIGGASAWLVLNICYLTLGSWLTHRILLKGKTLNWLTHDVGFPLVVSLIVTFTGWALLHRPGHEAWNVGVAVVTLIVAALVNVRFLPRTSLLHISTALGRSAPPAR